MRALSAALVLLVLPVSALTASQPATWPKLPQGDFRFECVDSTGLWRVVGGWSMADELRTYSDVTTLPMPYKGMALKQLWPGYQVMLDEGGEWFGFKIAVKPGCRLVLSARSVITLIDDCGEYVTGQMRLLRSPELGSCDVWDARNGLVIAPGQFMGGPLGTSIAVRFPAGKVRWKKVRAIAVEGVRVMHAVGGE